MTTVVAVAHEMIPLLCSRPGFSFSSSAVLQEVCAACNMWLWRRLCGNGNGLVVSLLLFGWACCCLFSLCTQPFAMHSLAKKLLLPWLYGHEGGTFSRPISP